MDDEKPMWSRQPNETERQFKVFQQYLHMLDDPEEGRRSLHRLAKRLGYANRKALEKWSTTNSWVERSAAYDDYMSIAIVQREVHDLGAYQEHVVESLTEQLAAMNDILNKEIKDVLVRQRTGSGIPPLELKRLMEAVKIKDDLARRTARLPTTYLSEQTDEEIEQRTFIVGTSNVK